MIETKIKRDQFLNMRLTENELGTVKALATLKKMSVNKVVLELVYKEFKKIVDDEVEKNYSYLMAESSLAEDWDSDADKVWDNFGVENVQTG
jgi:hypothetical protein